MQPICVGSPSEDEILTSTGSAFSHTRTTPKIPLTEHYNIIYLRNIFKITN